MPAGQPWDPFGTAFVSPSAVSTHRGSLNPKLAAVAFAFTTSSTVPLYSSLKAGHLNHKHKTKAYQSFRTLLIVSALGSFALTFPLAFFSSTPFSAVSPFPQNLRFSFSNRSSSLCRITPKHSQDHCELYYTHRLLS